MPDFNFGEAVFKQRLTVAKSRQRLLNLSRVVGYLSDSSLGQYTQILAACLEFKPDLIIELGRGVWDNWLICQAKFLKILLVGTIEVITAVHQIHDYSHAGGYDKVWKGEEHEHNMKQASKKRLALFLENADYKLTKNGLVKPCLSWRRLWRNLQVYPTLGNRWARLLWPEIVAAEVLIEN